MDVILMGVRMFRSFIAVCLVALGLAGCGSMRLVDSDVRSYTTPPLVPVGARYRFERLPSQQDQADTAEQTQLEAIVQPVLAKAGLQRDDAAAGYSVQISVDVKVDPYAPWDQSSIGWWPGFNFGRGVHGGNVWFVNHHSFRGWSGFGMSELPYYWYQVSLIIRSLNTAQVVYETHAAHDGRWANSQAILPAMFEAALQGFPNPPQGARHIDIEIPR